MHARLIGLVLLAVSVSADVITRIPDAAPPGYEQWTSEIVVPAKPVSGDADWAGSVSRARAFVAKLTLEEKINVTTGTDVLTRCVGNTGTIPRFGWKGLCLEDSPLGVRFADFVSAFPAAINVAATWDKGLMYARGKAMGEEFRGKGVNVALGPMTNLARIPAGGRNWEGFGADPFLSGVGSVQTVKGQQDVGVIATIKHYIANEQEHFRGGSQAPQISSSNIDDRTMHELYLWPFAEAVKAGVGAMMCSYQKVNQTQACQNSKILNGIFKEELDFQGFVMSDWAASINGVQPALAGMDMNMPGFRAYGQGPQNEENPVTATNGWWGANLLEAVRNGSVPEARVDDMVTRTFASWYKLGQDRGFPDVNFNQVNQDTYYNGQLVNEHIDVQADHYKVIREIGGASTVLLKNVKGALPLNLKNIRRIGVFGSDAGPNPDGPNGCSDRGCDQGTLAMGWGSGTSNFPYLIDPAAALTDYVRTNKPGVVIEPVLNDFNYGAVDRVSPYADTCLVFANADSGEGYITVGGNAGDRNNLTLWHGGDDLIQRVASRCANTIVTLHTVGAVIVESWIDHPNVTAVLWAGLPGQETGNAIVDVLFGAVNPSARLPYTIAKRREDYNADVIYESSETTPQQTYEEGLNIDYRHFDSAGIEPRFEFGFGLSYTSFAYSGLSVRGGRYRRQASSVVSSILSSATPAPASSSAVVSEPGSISAPLSSTLAPLPTVISSAVPSGLTSILSSAVSSAASSLSSGASSAISSGASSAISSGVSSGISSTVNGTATPTGSAPPVVSSPVQTTPGGAAELWDTLFTVSYTVQNTGNYDGAEVSQVYLGFPKSANEPPRVLRGFERTKLRRGQRETVQVTLRRKDVSIWDVVAQKWVVPKGTFKIEVGSSSRKIHLTGTFQT